jgi:hypothetical protein
VCIELGERIIAVVVVWPAIVPTNMALGRIFAERRVLDQGMNNCWGVEKARRRYCNAWVTGRDQNKQRIEREYLRTSNLPKELSFAVFSD